SPPLPHHLPRATPPPPRSIVPRSPSSLPSHPAPVSPRFFFLLLPPPPTSPLFPYTTLFRSPPLARGAVPAAARLTAVNGPSPWRSEEHTSELQSLTNLVCRLLLEKNKQNWQPARRRAAHPVC